MRISFRAAPAAVTALLAASLLPTPVLPTPVLPPADAVTATAAASSPRPIGAADRCCGCAGRPIRLLPPGAVAARVVDVNGAGQVLLGVDPPVHGVAGALWTVGRYLPVPLRPMALDGAGRVYGRPVSGAPDVLRWDGTAVRTVARRATLVAVDAAGQVLVQRLGPHDRPGDPPSGGAVLLDGARAVPVTGPGGRPVVALALGRGVVVAGDAGPDRTRHLYRWSAGRAVELTPAAGPAVVVVRGVDAAGAVVWLRLGRPVRGYRWAAGHTTELLAPPASTPPTQPVPPTQLVPLVPLAVAAGGAIAGTAGPDTVVLAGDRIVTRVHLSPPGFFMATGLDRRGRLLGLARLGATTGLAVADPGGAPRPLPGSAGRTVLRSWISDSGLIAATTGAAPGDPVTRADAWPPACPARARRPTVR
jgi:hypothetical protein